MADVYKDPTDAPQRTPSVVVRKGEGPMKDSELQPLIEGLIQSAIQFTNTELSPDRAKATLYYQGKPFGNEEEGRSQVVLSEVRDGIAAILPPLLRAVFGPEKVVEFRPRTPQAIPLAEQATAYVEYVFSEANAGFVLTHNVLKDGLLKKLGIFKWGWDESYEKCAYKLSDVSQPQLEMLAADKEIDLTRITTGADGLSEVELTRREEKGCAKVWALPPEEFIFARETASIDTALFVAHRTKKTRGELIAMGVDPALVKEHGTPSNDLQNNPEVIARNEQNTGIVEEPAGEANDKITYIESYARVDYDGDGIAELRKICSMGSGYHIVENEPVSEAPFAIFCPDPEPHALLGQSWYDRLKDMQLVKSSLLRLSLDSFVSAIYPRTWYRQGDANLADILNTALGAPIRTQSGAGAVGVFQHDFVGREAFPVLAYCDEIVERRTGQNKGAANMDMSALQSTEKSAAQAAVTASQLTQDLLARLFAEGTLKPLFKGLLRLLVARSPREVVARLNGQWVELDPRTWDADMDVTVNVMLGSGTIEERVATLAGIVEEMKFIFATFGLSNPFVTEKQYRDTLAEMAELRGRKDPSRYFKVIDQAALDQQKQQATQQPPPPSPEMMLAQAQIQLEQQKAQAKQQLEQATAQANLQLEQARAERQHLLEADKAAREAAARQAEMQQKQMEMLLEDDRLRDQQAAEIELKRYEIEARYGVQLRQQEVDAAIEHTRTATQAGVDMHATEMQAGTDMHATEMQAEMDRTAAASGETS